MDANFLYPTFWCNIRPDHRSYQSCVTLCCKLYRPYTMNPVHRYNRGVIILTNRISKCDDRKMSWMHLHINNYYYPVFNVVFKRLILVKHIVVWIAMIKMTSVPYRLLPLSDPSFCRYTVSYVAVGTYVMMMVFTPYTVAVNLLFLLFASLN